MTCFTLSSKILLPRAKLYNRDCTPANTVRDIIIVDPYCLRNCYSDCSVQQQRKSNEGIVSPSSDYWENQIDELFLPEKNDNFFFECKI